MKSTIIFIFSLIVLNLSGQNIHHQMISSQGSSSLTSSGLIVNQTIGQQSITGSFTGSFSVQQGFQQSYWYNYLSNSNPILVSVSPNPFQELIQFSISNLRNEKIAMTSPVAMKLEDSVTMMFMVPHKLEKEMLPKPNQSNIEFREEPAKTVAAISFEGWANDEKIEKYKEKLKVALDTKGIKYSNLFYFLGYNAPYEVFNRKNEVIVELRDEALDREKTIN